MFTMLNEGTPATVGLQLCKTKGQYCCCRWCPTMYQHWVNVSCLLGASTHNKHTQCPILLYNCWASDDSVLTLTHNRREAANIRRPRNTVNDILPVGKAQSNCCSCCIGLLTKHADWPTFTDTFYH